MIPINLKKMVVFSFSSSSNFWIQVFFPFANSLNGLAIFIDSKISETITDAGGLESSESGLDIVRCKALQSRSLFDRYLAQSMMLRAYREAVRDK